jgi:proline iminopeptidase
MIQIIFIALLFVSHCYAELSQKYVKADGAELFCQFDGKGEPLVVIHGGPGLSQDYLLPQMSRLSENYFVIFYDQRGCGRSTGELKESGNLDDFMNDIEAIRKEFGFEKISVMGHSWGGLLAMKYATVHPGCVKRLILVTSMSASYEDFNSFLEEWNKRMAPYKSQLESITNNSCFSEGDPKLHEQFLKLIFATYLFNPNKVCELNLSMSRKAALHGIEARKIFNVEVKDYDLFSDLGKLYVPTLIIHGDSDPNPLQSATHIRDAIKNSKLTVIKECGHFPYIEQPETFFKLLSP